MTNEELFFSGAGGFLFGAVIGYALKKLMKLMAVIVGLYLAGSMYMAYKGYITINWTKINIDTNSTLTNATIQANHVINSTAQNMAAHGVSTSSISGVPIAAIVGFLPGLFLGLRKG